LPSFFERHSLRRAKVPRKKAALCFPLANYLLGLLPVCPAQGFVDPFTIHASINPDWTRAAEVLPTLEQVGAMLLVSAIKAKHFCILFHYLVTDK
jgi:hypothetical protein